MISRRPSRRPLRPAALIVSLFAALATHAAAQPVVQSLTYLDAAYAYDVNDSGQVVGSTGTNTSTLPATYSAYLYSNGTMTNITPAGGGTSYAYGINNSGAAVGYSMIGYSPAVFTYSNGTSTNLSSAIPGIAYGRAINDAGTITGSQSPNAFSYTSNGTLTAFTVGYGFAINTAGHIAGSLPSGPSNIYTNAMLYNGTTATSLGTLGGTTSIAYGINDSDVAVGYSFTIGNSSRHAFSYSNGAMTDLGTLPGGANSTAEDVNNLGQIVGFSDGGANFAGNHAFLYTDGEMFDLTAAAQAAGFVNTGPITASTVGFTSLEFAYAISDTGYIVGNGIYYTGNWVGAERAFILKLETPSAVPEPSTYGAWLGLGTLAFGMLRRRRR